ncbi:MAG: hypothetical protein ACRCWJ_19020 [Casimicrobium sp.]
MPISKDLLAKIVDEAFGGNMEFDSTRKTVEDIHRIIMRELFVTPAHEFPPYPHARAMSDGILITISNDQLRFATEQHPHFWDGESGIDTPNLAILNLENWKKDVANEINDEAEDGSTEITRITDEAIVNAFQWGSEHIEPTSPEFK